MKGIFLFVKWRVSDLGRNLNFRFGDKGMLGLPDTNVRYWDGSWGLESSVNTHFVKALTAEEGFRLSLWTNQ